MGSELPTPVYFMIMPFGTKKTGVEPPDPGEIDFDALWRNALAPAIVELGFEPVRADQDLGALIITRDDRTPGAFGSGPTRTGRRRSRGMQLDLNDYYPSSNLERSITIRPVEDPLKQPLQQIVAALQALLPKPG